MRTIAILAALAAVCAAEVFFKEEFSGKLILFAAYESDNLQMMAGNRDGFNQNIKVTMESSR